MRLFVLFLIAVCLASCSSELIDSQEPENQTNEVLIDKGVKLRLVSQNVDNETIDSFLKQLSSQLQEPVEANPQKEHLKSNEIEFLPFPWWQGSYYWTNTANKNIAYQTYTVSYQNIQYSDQVMLLSVVREVNQSNPITHFYKWKYIADFGKGWEMTCLRAQLIGKDKLGSKKVVIIEEEVRVFDQHMRCVFLPDPGLTLGWQSGG